MMIINKVHINNNNHPRAAITWTCISWQAQWRTRGFCCSKVLLDACRCWCIWLM